ncbi:hypothetical protein AA313_de0203961 [Arthrobotrys entomopaga]|nr:hypothetical protein AA313_de0203961 [Arthrobotrys entomopaga]
MVLSTLRHGFVPLIFPLILTLTPIAAEIESHINLKIYFTDNTISTLSIDPKIEPYCRGIDFPLRKPNAFSNPKIGAIVAESHIASTEQIGGIDFSVYVGEDALSCDDYEKPPYELFLPYYAPGWNAKKVEEIETGGAAGEINNFLNNNNLPADSDSSSESDSDSDDNDNDKDHKSNRADREANSAISYMSPIRPVSVADDDHEDEDFLADFRRQMRELGTGGISNSIRKTVIPPFPLQGFNFPPPLHRQNAVDGRTAPELGLSPTNSFLENPRNRPQLLRSGTIFPNNNNIIETESISLDEEEDVMDKATMKAEDEGSNYFEEEKEPYDSPRIKKRYAPSSTEETTKTLTKRALENWPSASPIPQGNSNPPSNHILRPAPMTTKQELYPDSQEPFLFFSDPTSFILYAKITPKNIPVNPVPLYEEIDSGSIIEEGDPYGMFMEEDLDNLVNHLVRGGRTT